MSSTLNMYSRVHQQVHRRMKTNVEWGEAESKISGTNVLYQARTYIATPLAGCTSHEVSREHFQWLQFGCVAFKLSRVLKHDVRYW